MKRHLIGLFATAFLLALAGLLLLWDASALLRQPLRLVEAEHIDVKPGSRLREAVGKLSAEGAFSHARVPIYLEVWARATGEATRIKAGEYRIEPGASAMDVLRMMVDGEVVLHELRVVEGQRFKDLTDKIAQHPEIEHSLASLDAERVMLAMGKPGLHPEGRFFPDTYKFPRGTRDVDLLRQAFDAMEKVLQEEWENRADDLAIATPEEALVLASIIEKETGLAAEREQISGVFSRRLRKGMLLQTDPTVIYGIGDAFDGNIRRRDLRTDTPYNTYTRAGLPPSPICLPGRASIRAALHPEDGDSLYFVSRGDGSHYFSATLAEHERAVRKYQLGKGG